MTSYCRYIYVKIDMSGVEQIVLSKLKILSGHTAIYTITYLQSKALFMFREPFGSCCSLGFIYTDIK